MPTIDHLFSPCLLLLLPPRAPVSSTLTAKRAAYTCARAKARRAHVCVCRAVTHRRTHWNGGGSQSAHRVDVAKFFTQPSWRRFFELRTFKSTSYPRTRVLSSHMCLTRDLFLFLDGDTFALFSPTQLACSDNFLRIVKISRSPRRLIELASAGPVDRRRRRRNSCDAEAERAHGLTRIRHARAEDTGWDTPRSPEHAQPGEPRCVGAFHDADAPPRRAARTIVTRPDSRRPRLPAARVLARASEAWISDII